MTLLFIGLVGALAIGAVLFAKQVYRIRYSVTVSIVFGWLALQGVLAHAGFFSDFKPLPPHLALILIPSVIFLAICATLRRIAPPLNVVSPIPLVAFQSFRIVMEFVLFRLIQEGALPELLTFTGSNFDILVGATAPFAALLLMRQQSKAYVPVLIWNVIGFVILVNTAVHGVLAAPTPFQVFHTEPSTALIAEFPWIWLPGFVVPCALVGHVLSIRQLLGRGWR